MRIALIIEHFDAARGGAEKLSVWIAHQLAARGHTVDVVCHDARERVNKYRVATRAAGYDATISAGSHAESGGGDAPHPENIRVHKLRGLKLSTGVGFRHFGRRARLWCRRNEVDIVHSISIAYPGDIYRPEAGIYRGIHEAAIASRDHGPDRTLKRILLRLNGKQRTLLELERRLTLPPPLGPRRIIALSQMVRDQLRHWYGVPAQSIIRLDNPRMDPPPKLARQAEDRSWFRGHYKLGEQDRVAVFVGHDFRRKGLRWAIEAIAQSKSGWKLLVVGLGKVRDYIALARRLNIADRITFVGPTKEMPAVYAASDALLLPTFYDSFGLVALEALSYGLPVVSTRGLGCAPIVDDNQVGTIVSDPRDTRSMAAALDALPAGGPDRTALAARARAASAGLTGDLFMDRLLDIYEEVAREKRSLKT